MPDVIEPIIGPCGIFQTRLYFSIVICKVLDAFHLFGIIFLAPKVSYVCASSGKETCPCPDPKFNRSQYVNTMTMEWNLICDRKWMVSLTQTLLQLGVLIGSILFGVAADWYGRKKPLLAAVVVQLASALGGAITDNYWVWTFCRFLLGISVGGTMVTSFVIFMEFVGTKYREIMTALYQVPFTVGNFMLPVIAYFFVDFYKLQIALSAPAFLMLLYVWCIPDTPRWLIAVDRQEEAIDILTYVAKINKRPVTNIKESVETYAASLDQHKKKTIIDMFRYPNLRKNITLMSFNWFACSYCFYGVTQYIGLLSGDPHLNVAASGVLCFTGAFVAMALMKLLPRKGLLITFHFICAFCLLCLALYPNGKLSVLFACVGVLGSFIVFLVVYVYCMIFPTVVRNAALGFSSMAARAGSMIAPFVIDTSVFGEWLPPLLFAFLPLIAGILTFFLPECKGLDLMTTLTEGENIGRKDKAMPTKSSPEPDYNQEQPAEAPGTSTDQTTHNLPPDKTG